MLFYRNLENTKQSKIKHSIQTLKNYYNFPLSIHDSVNNRLENLNAKFQAVLQSQRKTSPIINETE